MSLKNKLRPLLILALAPACLCVFLNLPVRAELASHNFNAFPPFQSKQDITNFFAQNHISIEVFELKNFSSENLVFASYPYSGLDTIDVFYFVKYGERWNLKMVYFYLRPKERKLKLAEQNDRIIIRAAGEDLVSLMVDKTLNSLKR